MNSLVPSCILLVLLVASITATILLFSASEHSMRIIYQGDIAKVNDNLRSVQTQQTSYAQQVQTLTKLVSESLNATDEYIHNITNAVSETKDVMQDNMATVADIQESQNSLMAVQFAGMFTLLVILVSGYHLSQHLRYMHSPVVQRKIMAVLWMTPIYSLTSWLSLVFEGAEPYLAVIREFYESYCVYTFLSFLIAVLGRGDRWAVVDLLEQRADQLGRVDKCRCGPKAFKRCWQSCLNKCGKRRRLPNGRSLSESVRANNHDAEVSIDEHGNQMTPARIKAEAVLDQCQMYAMQFVLLRPLTAIGWLVSNQLVEPKTFLDPTTPQLYITIITNGSIFFAFRGLVTFYHATRSNLAWCNPWPKFLCIKGVVFMTFWQRMMLSLIVNLGYSDHFDTQEKANAFIFRAQNFLICLEMLFSAVAHTFVFSPDEWADGYRQREEERRKSSDPRAFGDSVALGDFISDVKVVLASKKRRKRRKKIKRDGTGLGSLSSGASADDEGTDTLELAISQSSEGDIEDDGDEIARHASYEPKSTSESMISGSSNNMQEKDELERKVSFDDAEYVMSLATPSPATTTPVRRRLDTGGSVESDGGDFGVSLARIEQFLTTHSPKTEQEKKEIV